MTTVSYQITSEQTRQLKDIELKAAEMSNFLSSQDPDFRRAIQRQAFISTIGASTRIENAVLTDAQIEWIDTTLTTDGRPTKV